MPKLQVIKLAMNDKLGRLVRSNARLLALNLGILIVLTSPIAIPIAALQLGIVGIKSKTAYRLFSPLPALVSPIDSLISLYRDMPLRNILQYDNHCFKPDLRLVYVPRPWSRCHQDELEFDADITFGRYGDRQSSNLISSPYSLAVLGDSHAMGWGVSDRQIFTQYLSLRGISALNLSVSSYGTVRELERLRLWSIGHPKEFASIKTILIVYNPNDLAENRSFISDSKYISYIVQSTRQYASVAGTPNPFHLGVSASIPAYMANPVVLARLVSSFWRAFSRQLSQLLLSLPSRLSLGPLFASTTAANVASSKAEHASTFLSVLLRYSSLLNGKNVLVVISDDWGMRNQELSEQFGALSGTHSSGVRSFSVRVLSPAETGLLPRTSSYYLIDDHPSPLGHYRLSNAILRALGNGL